MFVFNCAQHVESLQYADRPDYDYVVECLETICRKIHAPPDDKYDWERTPAEKVAAHQVLTLYDVACVNYEPPSPRCVLALIVSVASLRELPFRSPPARSPPPSFCSLTNT